MENLKPSSRLGSLPIRGSEPVNGLKPAARLPRAWPGLLAGLLLLAGCSPQNNLRDDRNPFYLMGLRLRQENKHEEAAEAFEKCLRLSPASAKADLQLAMLAEERLGDPIRAVYHYHAYLRKAPKGEHAEMARKWLARAERTYLRHLMDRYPEDVDLLLGKTGIAGGVPSALSPREAYFVRRIKELSAENSRLQETVTQLSSTLNRLEPPVPATAGAAVSGLSETSAAGSRDPVPGAASAIPAVTRQEPTPAAGYDDGPLIDPAERREASLAPAAPDGTAGAAAAAVVSRDSGSGKTSDSAATASASAAPGVSGAAAASAAADGTPAPAAGGRNFIPLKRLTTGGLPPASATAGGIVRIYTVQPGDTLSGIARKFYGRYSDWTIIQDANRKLLANGTALKPGLKLTIPPAAGTTRKEPRQP